MRNSRLEISSISHLAVRQSPAVAIFAPQLLIGVARVGELPGLVILLDNVRRQRQVELFIAVLEVVRPLTSMTNKVAEVASDGTVSMYDLPRLTRQVGDEDQLLINELLEKLWVFEPAPSTMSDVVRFKSALVRDRDEVRGETFVDQESHSK